MKLFLNLIKRYAREILLFVVILVFLISYFRIPFLFFQQDEVFGFGLFIKEGWRVLLYGLGAEKVRHFVPLTMFLSYSIFKFFGLSYLTYNVIGLLFHFANGILLYYLARNCIKNKNIALSAVLIFFSSSVAAQLIMWPVINVNSISLTFSLLSWLAVLKKKLLWVPILFLCAVFSVEYSAGLIFFIPLAVFLTFGNSTKEKIVKLIPFSVVSLGYILFRLLPIVFAPSTDLLVSGVKESSFLIRIFSLVARYFGQLFFGQDILLFISKAIQIVGGVSWLGTAYAETNIFPVVSLFLGVFLIIFSLLIYRKIEKKNKQSSTFLLAFAFIIFSSLPFLLIPGGVGLSSVISSRYMYFGLAGMALLTACVIEFFYAQRKKTGFFFVCTFVFLIVVVGTLGNFNRAAKLYEQGKVRLKILNTIKSEYPSLPNKVVFYVVSDRSYYGLPEEEKILPFQSGFGQTLLIYYNQAENFPKDFFPGSFLWDITSQGYEEHGGRGFGYFRDVEMLKSAINKYNIPISSVIAFSWSGETDRLANITAEIREKIYK